MRSPIEIAERTREVARRRQEDWSQSLKGDLLTEELEDADEGGQAGLRPDL